MAFSLRMLACFFLACTSAHGRQLLPGIQSIMGMKPNDIVKSVTEVTQTASSQIMVGPLTSTVDNFHVNVKDMTTSIKGKLEKTGVDIPAAAKAMDQMCNGTVDAADVNGALKVGVAGVDSLSGVWNDAADMIDTNFRVYLNDLSTVGLTKISEPLSVQLDAALLPLQQTNQDLFDAKALLVEASKPWTSNADTDVPLEGAIAKLEQAVTAAQSGRTKLLDFTKDTVSGTMDAAALVLPGDQVTTLMTALSPTMAEVDALLGDADGGLVTETVVQVATLSKSLKAVREITEAAATLAGSQSAAEGLRGFSSAVGALVLIALTAVTA